MIHVQLKFEHGQMDEALRHLKSLDGSERPLRYGISPQGKKGDVSREEKFQKFLEKNPMGFMLFGEGVQYTIVDLPSLGITIDCEIDESRVPDATQVAQELLRDMARARPLFGFAADPEEYFHRHRSVTTTPDGTVEGFEGTNPAAAIPGLYWMTLISDELAARHGVGLQALTSQAQGVQTYAGGLILEFYSDPHQWLEYAPKLDGIAVATPGIFSKNKPAP